MDETSPVNLTQRERDTILAALRYWQRHALGGPTKVHCLAEYDIAANDRTGTDAILSADEIDVLCECKVNA